MKKQELIGAVKNILPEALKGFGIKTSKQLVKKHKALIKYIFECIQDEYNINDNEVKSVVVNVVDDWGF